MTDSQTQNQPKINQNARLQRYYASLESRIGYRLFLGDTRHYGFYPKPNASPFPVGRALRAMEHELLQGLNCLPGSKVLDAGCGFGHVASYMARIGDFNVDGIDVVERHALKAKQNIKRLGLEDKVTVRHGDYHHLEDIVTGTYDGVYTMETLVHSTDPLAVLKEFHRILKPGGHIALNEYDHADLDKIDKDYAIAMQKVNKYAAMPANNSFDYDVLKTLVEQAGFEEVELRDLSANIMPMLWFFYVFAIVPYLIFKLLGIDHHFVNTIAGVEGYRGRHGWRYIQLTGQKKM